MVLKGLNLLAPEYKKREKTKDFYHRASSDYIHTYSHAPIRRLENQKQNLDYGAKNRCNQSMK